LTEPPKPDESQIERAQRLREKIKELNNTGTPEQEDPGKEKSIKEQIAERVAELNKQRRDK